MTDIARARPGRLPVSRSEEWWQLAAALLGLLFGNLCLRWSPLHAFEAAAALVVLLVCVLRPFAGMLLTLGLALSLEQYAIITGSAIRLNAFTAYLGRDFFANLSLFVRLPWLYLNAMELLMLVSLLSWFAHALRAGNLRWRGGALAAPLLLMLLTLGLAVARGLQSGAETRLALWEVRTFLQLGLAYFIAAHAIERRSHVRAVVWVVAGAVIFRSLVALWNAGVVLRFRLDLVEAVTPHEDALFLAWAILLGALLALYRAGAAQRRALGFFLLALLAALFFSKRRAGMVAVVAAIPFFLALLDRRRLRTALFALLLLSLPAGLFTAAFWNSEGAAGTPARVIRAVAAFRQSERDRASDRFRVLENHILVGHIRANPLLGIGFGRPYRGADRNERDMATREADSELPRLNYELARYIPHNQVLWIWAKAGLVGFAAFWLFVTVAISYGTRLAVSLKDPYFRAVAAATVLLVGMQMLVSFVDQVMTSYRCAIYLGVMLGMLVRLREIEKREP